MALAEHINAYDGEAEGLDDEPIRVTKGNAGLANIGSDAVSIGFRETKSTLLLMVTPSWEQRWTPPELATWQAVSSSMV